MHLHQKLVRIVASVSLAAGLCPQAAFASMGEEPTGDALVQPQESSGPIQDDDGPTTQDAPVPSDMSASASDGPEGGSGSTDPATASATGMEPSVQEIEAAVTELELQEADRATVVATVNEDQTYVTLAAQGGDFDRATSVQFPTWAQGGRQADIRWYTAFKWGGAWICTVPLLNHQRIDAYIVHAYGVISGSMQFIASTSFSLTAPTGTVSCTSGTGDCYTVRIVPDSVGPAIDTMQVASWKAVNADQAGIVWVPATEQPDGSWVATISTLGPSRGDGVYANHAYATCANGAMAYVGSSPFDFASDEDAHLSVSVNENETTATITASGGAFARASTVQFPTWGQVGQADIRWYDASHGNGVWSAQVNLSNHRTTGTFNVHAYGVIGGKLQYIAATSFVVHSPTATLALSQDAAKDPNAPLVATLTLTSHEDLVEMVSMPTWTAQNGQDDIVWYIASSDADDAVWLAEIPTTGAGRGAGTYISHAYATLANGTQFNIATASAEVTVGSAPAVTIQLDDNQTQAKIHAAGGELARASSVRFAVWSAMGGQDDLRWYTASRESSGWTCGVQLSNHRATGIYNVHVYGIVDGRDGFRATGAFNVDAPAVAGAVSLTQTPDQIALDEATVSARIDPSSPAVSAVQFPVWTRTNGQDDIVWYNGRQSDDGLTWTAAISTSGTDRGDDSYTAHVYGTCANGVFAYLGSASADLKVNPSALLDVVLDQDQTTVSITASGGAFARATAVSFPTWGAPNQSDIRWYDASKVNGAWKATVNIGNHRLAGVYHVHAYATVAGNLTFVASGSFEVGFPTGTVTITQTEDQVARDEATATFAITGARAASAPKVSYVQFPTWTARNGQDDIVWYRASKADTDDGSTWSVTIPTSGIGRGSGSYITHCYVGCANGAYGYAASASKELKAGETPIFSAKLSDDHTTITVTASGGAFSTASSVQFPTWSTQNGQDDIQWYTAGKSGGVWTKDITVSNHRTAGTYVSHAYVRNNDVLSCVAAASTDAVEGPAAGAVSAAHDGNGTLKVIVSDLESKSGIKAVQVPTWTAQDGQDDIIWHSAVEQSDGSWVATIPASDHQGQEDSYISHAYATSGNNIQSMVGLTHTFVPLKNYIYMTGTYGSGSRTVWVKNPTSSQIQVPTWSSVGGQDDIRWINGTHVGNNLYRADIDCRGLKHAGNAISHVYIGGKNVRALSFNVAESEIIPAHLRVIYNRIAGLASRTDWLIAVDTDSCTVAIFHGSQNNWTLDRSYVCSPGAWGSPTKKGDFTVGIKGYSFGHGYSCYYFTQFSGNYLFHSVKYYQGTFNVMDGRLGEHVSAGCVRLQIDNAKWIYDHIPYGTRVLVW